MRLKTSFIAALFGLALSPAHADTIGSWHTSTVKNYQSYYTVNKLGSRFTIWCPVASNGGLPLIGINIKGGLPSSNSKIKIELDHHLVKFKADRDGYIRPDCPSCADNMRYFWQLLRSSVRFAVLFEDRRFAGFSTKGVRDMIPATICAPRPSVQAKK